MFHYRKKFKQYMAIPKAKVCTFCEDDMASRAIRTTEYFYVVPNKFFYDLWELRKVTDHLLIIPRQHAESLLELNDAARLELVQICGEYEGLGYHTYACGLKGGSRSVDHQHTHLIKTEQKRALVQIAVSKPHILVKI